MIVGRGREEGGRCGWLVVMVMTVEGAVVVAGGGNCRVRTCG